MRRVRVIPVLQILNRKLVKTTCFRSPAYIGDPLNAIRIFNQKNVDEIAVLDISATREKKIPDLDFISKLASECFIPMSYGGGISHEEQAFDILRAGVEKVIIGSAFMQKPELVNRISNATGAQSVVVSVDVKKNWFRKERVFINSGSINTGYDPLAYVNLAQKMGAGEILLHDINREGTGKGYNIALIENVVQSITIPVVPIGGCNTIGDFAKAINVGASAVAAGNFFIYHGPHKAVLISYPDQHSLENELYKKILNG